ncbi:MAG: hypothetical protein HY540_07425 [Deltaproteobacteria bacterium]|nr:hypothetical protein [Deltaproteobacteria bacterium]
MNSPWYIVQTKPQFEDQVRQRFSQVGFEVFLPRLKKLIKGKSHHTSRISPLFPSYLFLHLNLTDPQKYRLVRFTRGVRKVLGSGDFPIPVDESVINVLRERLDSEGLFEQCLRYTPGDTVRIKNGPLEDLVGVLEKDVSATGRVRVLLQVYHKTIRAEIPCTDVELV